MIIVPLQELQAVSTKRPLGYLEDVLSKGKVDGDRVLFARDVYLDLRSKYSVQPPPRLNRSATRQTSSSFSSEGPGTELKKLLSKLRLKAKPGCKCNARMLEMNRWGPDVCEQNIGIIVGWLREEAVRSGYPFSEFVAKILVRKAIKNSKRAIASVKS